MAEKQVGFECKYCEDYYSSYKDVTTNHWSVCGYYPLPCPNKCGEMIQRQNLQSHITNNCLLTIIDCDFQHVGCEVRLPRKDMPEHLQDVVTRHLSLQAACYKYDMKKQQEEVTRLEEENKQLKQQLEKLTQNLQIQKICTPICPVEFTVTNFDQKRKDNIRWQSPPFYTHLKGYKLCMDVCAAGRTTLYEGTHVTIYIGMMKGEFDDQLDWPFRGKIEIQLLNQERDEGHHTGTLDFEGKYLIETAKRVTKGDVSKERAALFDFISHGDLRPKYLNNNNSLKFRIDTIIPVI